MVLGLVFAAVESEWPHAAAAYMIDDEAMAKARLEIRALLDRYAECRREGAWPGYPSAIRPISMPAWAQ
jgi:exodeoxyribonuclease VIII